MSATITLTFTRDQAVKLCGENVLFAEIMFDQLAQSVDTKAVALEMIKKAERVLKEKVDQLLRFYPGQKITQIKELRAWSIEFIKIYPEWAVLNQVDNTFGLAQAKNLVEGKPINYNSW